MYSKWRKHFLQLLCIVKRESEKMVEPRTYIGYDKDNKEITKQTATDANTLINPEEVQAKIDALDEVADGEIENIVSNMRNITADELGFVR